MTPIGPKAQAANPLHDVARGLLIGTLIGLASILIGATIAKTVAAGTPPASSATVRLETRDARGVRVSVFPVPGNADDAHALAAAAVAETLHP